MPNLQRGCFATQADLATSVPLHTGRSAGAMPGPAAQTARQFFNAKNTLERKHLGEFLHELQALQVMRIAAQRGCQ